ncbi:integral membrane protein gpr180 [Stylonychia lemnae]|uniref:Integral membrane protein gpr180 n=1 Tax=Stylonychia lemnae TaxID=5949 RepID=A0A078AYM5_STYLE|nr:integral membrane protein gpr180 [Stylonychia lemnae]|eukprot:CDW87269.1 integral membrane protein gpr180 [Stylonychia lemnae]
MKVYNKISILFSVNLLLSHLNSKFTSCYLNENSESRWKFCTKMAFGKDSQGKMSYQGTVLDDDIKSTDIKEENYVNLLAYKEGVWEQKISGFMRNLDCNELQSYAYLTYQVKLEKDQPFPVENFKDLFIRDIPQVWFFAIADCDKRAFIGEDEIDFKVDLMIMNNETHFSEERQGMTLFYISAFLVFALVLGANVYKYVTDLFQYNRPDTPILLLMMSATLQIAHIFFQLIHQTVYSYNGIGIFLLDILSTLQLIISQIIMAFLFLLLSFGWTITKNNVAMEELDLIIPISCFVIIMHVIVGGLIFIDNEEHHKFHDYSGIQGFMLCFMRILLFMGFIYGLYQTRKEIKDQRKLEYMRQLLLSGSLYFLSLPFFLLLCNLLSPYNQQLFFVFSTFFTQLLSFILLLYQFGTKRSKYHQASYQSDTVLPQSKEY